MSAPLQGDAAFRWTISGQDFIHYLGHPLHRPVADDPEQVHEFVSADLSTTRRVTIPSTVSDLRALIRWDGQTQSLREFLKAARQGASLEYFPSIANPSESYPCELVNGDEIQLDSDFWWNRRNSVPVRLRRTDGGSWQGLTEGTLFYYTAGNDLPGLTFTRTGTVGTYFDEDGVLQNEGTADIFRTSWADVPGLLLEAARTNEFLHSESLDNAAWTKSAASVTADQATGPDGVTSLDEIIEDGTTAAHLVQQTRTLTADADYAVSGWFRANSRTWVSLWLQESGAGTNFVRAWFNLSTGVVGTSDAGGTGTLARAYISESAAFPGLYRCVVVGSVGNAATSIIGQARLATADAVVSYAGDGSSSVFGGYMQLEDSALTASSYIPTTTGAVTRNVETLYFDFTAAPQEMTLYFKLRARMPSGEGTNDRVMHIGAAGAATDPRITIFDGANGYRVEFDNGTTVRTTADTLTAVAYDDDVELRLVLNADGSVLLGQSIASAAEETTAATATNTMPTAWADTRLYLNSAGSTLQGLNEFEEVKSAGGSKTMAEMRAL